MKSEGLGYAEIVKGSEVLIDGMEGVKSMLCGGRTRVANVRSIDRRPLILCYGELPQRVPVTKLPLYCLELMVELEHERRHSSSKEHDMLWLVEPAKVLHFDI